MSAVLERPRTGGNARLSAALVESNTSVEALADALHLDRKTVERWVNEPGRTPYARHAHAAAKLLGAEAQYLWPTLGANRPAPAAADELVTAYPSRSAAPADLWERLLNEAGERIDIAVSCALFLADSLPDLPHLLAERALCGVRVRLALPDPAALAPDQAARQQLAAELMPALPDLAHAPGVRVVRHHGIANDVLRADGELLVSLRVDGCTATASPVLHLRRLARAPLSAVYLTGLDHVFDTATPWRPARQEARA